MKFVYEVVVSVNGFDSQRDKKILTSLENKDRRLCRGMGFSLIDGRRDIFFFTHKKEIAKRLEKNLRSALKTVRIRGKVQTFKDQKDS